MFIDKTQASNSSGISATHVHIINISVRLVIRGLAYYVFVKDRGVDLSFYHHTKALILSTSARRKNSEPLKLWSIAS